MAGHTQRNHWTNMKMKINSAFMFAPTFTLIGAALMTAAPANAAPRRPQGPCDIYASGGAPCVAAHSTTRALYASYNGPLYQVLRQSDGAVLNIGVVQAAGTDAGGYADARAQDAFCANTYCWITTIYDQSPKHNNLTQPPRGAFSGPSMGGLDNLPIADMAPITIMGHKVYGVFIEPGMGLREDDAKGTAVDDQAEGQYWVINGRHFNSGCCFDYGNAEIDSRDDGNGTMETAYFGDATPWYHGKPPGPWVMTDQENNLVGCVNPDGSKLCQDLPNIPWRFVTAIAKGEPHHWTSMGGDAQQGVLSVMFNGPRVNSTYDPMRKQGAILLGNGGDNSDSSQGTFYEGAMTAAGTFPTDATDQQVQANVVTAGYGIQQLSLAPASATTNPPGLQTFSPGSSQDTTVTFTNTTASSVSSVKLSISLPSNQWHSVVSGTTETSKTFADPVIPGASVSATFKVTSGPANFNGDLVASASWISTANGKKSEAAAEKVRNVRPIKINEFSINSTNSFIELYNASSSTVDLSSWTLTEHPAQQAISSTVTIPSQTKLAVGGFYLLGLSSSGLAIPAHAGDATIHVRTTDGMAVGDTIRIDIGSGVETRKIVTVGTAASNDTTLWQPLPEGPIITIPSGSTNVPVANVNDFVVGEKIALGYGATYPVVARGIERYEIATVSTVGKPGTQAYLWQNAAAGATNIKVTSVANISVGDKIRLDIDSVGHGIETVTVKSVGTAVNPIALTADAKAGTTNIRIRNANGIAVGDKLAFGRPWGETVTVTALGPVGPDGASLDFTPALTQMHPGGEQGVHLGTGLELTAPLRFSHAANLPFSDRGTGISFQPATTVAHSSNEPIQGLGTGVTLDRPLTRDHAIDTVVQDAKVTTSGYQGTQAPNQWFGGPALSPSAGSMVLRNAGGLVVDSLNYGLLVDPWAAEGYQAASRTTQSGCRVVTPRAGTSAGRFPDGADTDSNCSDFVTEPASTLSSASIAGAKNVKVTSVDGFHSGQTITIDHGAGLETGVIATVGTAGASTMRSKAVTGTTVLEVGTAIGFSRGQTISIDDGANSESAVIVSTPRRGAAIITVATPLKFAHPAGTQISGTGITLTTALVQEHPSGALITTNAPTPGAPNQYDKPTGSQ
jgi:hypothetical protein